jgi:hypothetical protein
MLPAPKKTAAFIFHPQIAVSYQQSVNSSQLSFGANRDLLAES